MQKDILVIITVLMYISHEAHADLHAELLLSFEVARGIVKVAMKKKNSNYKKHCLLCL